MPPVTKVSDQTDLISTSKYPHAKFPFENFNPVQSRVFDFFEQETSAVIAAATSSGKTIAAEMFFAYVVRVLKKKALYLSPMRALAQEKYDDWTDKRHHFSDLKISVCTGDYRITQKRISELDNADIIIMSSEMLNHRARNQKSEQSKFLFEVGVCAVDESHLLTVPGRGDHLEAGLMKFTELNPNARLVLLSATMPNVEEIADWVSYVLTQKNTFLLKSTYRPCPLNVHYEKYWDGEKKYEDNELQKINLAMQIVEYYPDDKFLIFTHTKRTGELMRTALRHAKIECEFHNADLIKDKRINLEQQFKTDSKLRVVVATSTLAWGCYEIGTIVLTEAGIKKIENVSEGDYVVAMCDNGLCLSRVLKTGPKEVAEAYEFITETGEHVVVSPNHLFFGAIERKKVNYYKASQFSIGDYVAVPFSVEKWSNISADNYGYIIGYCFGDGCKTCVGQFSDGQQKAVLDITFGQDEFRHVDYMRELFRKVFNYSMPSPCVDKNGCFHLRTKQRNIVAAIPMLCGRYKRDLSVFQMGEISPEFIKGFLQGLFDTDGGFSDHNNGNVSIEFSTISKNLAHEVQQLLLFFGVRASVGKKKVKDTVIRGRLQLARRDYIYRVRIYHNEVRNFCLNVGFRNIHKMGYGLYFMDHLVDGKSQKDIVPAREMLISHANANNLSPHEMTKSVQVDLWTALHKQDVTRVKCKEIVDRFPNSSDFTKLLNSEVRFVKIKFIGKLDGNRTMYDLAVECQNYVGGGVVSHNCNLPARRVIILGVHRGMSEVATYDVWQMVGRAGRPAYDPLGDAYILLPEKTYDMHKERLRKPQPIQSSMLDDFGGKHKVLAFHLVSEIHQGNIKDRDDVHHWYKRSLAAFQSHELDDEVVEKTMELLKKCGAVWEEDGKYTVTTVGKISSLFYFSPFDVFDLKRNFNLVFDNHKENDDIWLSVALGNVDTQRCGIVSRVEREEMSRFAQLVAEQFGQGVIFEPAIKAAFAYHLLMTGKSNNHFAGIARGLQFDFQRMNMVLQALDSFTGKWGRKQWFHQLGLRVMYGVKGEQVIFCSIKDVGKVRANKLWDAGFRTIKDVAFNENGVKQALKCPSDLAKNICENAKIIMLS